MALGKLQLPFLEIYHIKVYNFKSNKLNLDILKSKKIKTHKFI